MYLSSSMEFEKGILIWQEAEVKPFDCRRLQVGMFTDRPDLWRKPKKKQRSVAPSQMTLDLSSEESTND